MFYRIKDNKLYDYADFKYAENCQETNITTQKDLDLFPQQFTIIGNILVKNPNYKNELSQKLEQEFYNNFFKTELGWYRKIPSGYANAPQSIDIVNNIVNIQGNLSEEVAQMLIFYKKPDFTTTIEDIEKSLIQTSYHPNSMSLEDWRTFYINFNTNWAKENYQKQ